MLHVTPGAGELLTSMQALSPADAVVRLIADGDGVNVQFDVPRTDDTTWQLNDQIVLLLSPALAEAMTTMTLDVTESSDGIQLVLKPRLPGNLQTSADSR